MSRDILTELAPILYPRSVAIVGVSTKEGNQGRIYLEAFMALGFPRIYPVNHKGGRILGLEVYPSIKAIPGEVDLAILTVPSEAVLEIARDCAQKGVKGLLIHSAGFSEKGAEGKELEEQIVTIAREGGMRVIGPNCMGIYNPAGRVAILEKPSPESGPLGVISHSGYLAGALNGAAATRGMRFSKVISCGNESDLTAADFLDYLGHDPETKIIIAYLEGIKEGRRFFQLAREISSQKPIIVWKGGMTESGVKAAASHTGALAISSNIWRALCSQAGIISVDSAEQLMDTTLAFYFLPRPNGRRVGIISSGGGFAVTGCDACIEAGLKLAKISPQTQARLAEIVEPVGTSDKNPVDIGIPGARAPEYYYKESVDILGKDPNVDMILIIGSSGDMDDSRQQKVADILLKAMRGSGKPVVISNPLQLQPLPAGYLELLAQKGIPVYPDPCRAASALGKFAQYNDFLRDAENWH